MRPKNTLHILALAAGVWTMACSDALTAVAPSPAATTGATPPSPPTPAERAPAALGPLHLTGGGFLTEYTVSSSRGDEHSWNTTVLASNGSLVEDNGRCCRILGDTVFQLNFGGVPTIGSSAMQPPTLVIGGGDFRHYGANDALLIIRDGDLRMRFFVPINSWRLDVSAYLAPTEAQPGEIRGQVVFEAVELVQEKESQLAPTFLRQLEGTTRVSADFVTPLRYKFTAIQLPF